MITAFFGRDPETARVASTQNIFVFTAKRALIVTGAIIEHLKPRLHLDPVASAASLGSHVRNRMAGSRRRYLRMDARMPQPGEPDPHHRNVIEKQRYARRGIGLVDFSGRPIVTVFREQVGPVFKTAIVQQADLVKQELLDLSDEQQLS